MLAVSDAVLNGTDLECGDLYQLLEQGVNKGYLSEKDIDVSLKRLFTILFKIGLFDSGDMSRNPYFSIGREVLECPAHKAQAYEMACKSMVLLKNEKHILPLNPKNLKRIALIGPNADDPQTLLANYYECFVLHIRHHVSFSMVCITVQPEQSTPACTNYYDNYGYEIQLEKAVLFK